MSPMPRPARRDPDPVEVAGARLRALRLVPAAPAAEPGGVAWPDEPVWGGWVPEPTVTPAGRAGPWDDTHLVAGGSAAPAEVASPSPTSSSSTVAATWDRLLVRLPLPLAGALQRLGWPRAAGLVVALLIAAAAVAGGAVGRHLATVGPPVAQSLPDLGGPSGSSDPSGATGGAGPATLADAGTSAAVGAGASGSIVVDVEGRVRRPGLVTLPSGARVADAVRAAGGLRGRVHDPSLDLAARVGDGQLLDIGRGAAGSTGGVAGGVGDGGVGPGSDLSPLTGGATTGPLNLNTASEAQLEALPGVGPVLAGRILEYRQQHGGFTGVSALQDVPGIGPSHYAEISPLVTT